MSEVSFNWSLEASQHDEVAGEYERMVDKFDNLFHSRPRAIEAGMEAYEMLKPFVESSVALLRGKTMDDSQVVLYGLAGK
jgi:hypothetical protein